MNIIRYQMTLFRILDYSVSRLIKYLERGNDSKLSFLWNKNRLITCDHLCLWSVANVMIQLAMGLAITIKI